MVTLRQICVALCFLPVAIACTVFADEADYYRIVSVVVSKSIADSRADNWNPPPNDLALEVSGLAVLDDRRVAVAIRKGEIWFLDGVYDEPANNLKYHRFAAALHEPLGLLQVGDALYCAQRSELTAMRDTDGDQVADEYRTVAKGWSVTGNYHEYAYGPKMDGAGNLWITLNIGMGLAGDQLDRIVPNAPFGYKQGRWRGWGLRRYRVSERFKGHPSEPSECKTAHA